MHDSGLATPKDRIGLFMVIHHLNFSPWLEGSTQYFVSSTYEFFAQICEVFVLLCYLFGGRRSASGYYL